MEIINFNIKFIRTHNRLTQSEYAEKLETSRDNISKYEGKSIPKPDFLRRLSKEFNINLHSLFLTKMTPSNYEHFILTQDSLTGNLDFQAEPEEIEKITAKDVRMFDSLIKEKIEHLKHQDLNENDRNIILDKIYKYQKVLMQKLIEFYDKQSQLFEYLSDRGILPK